MKNFSDLLATENSVLIQLKLRAITDNGMPWCDVKVNQQSLFAGPLQEILAVEHKIGLLDPISISVEMKNKVYSSQAETAVVLEQLTIDNFDILSQWTHLANYDNDHSANTPTSYLGFNGVWSLDITEPFYRWRHKITGQGWLITPH